MMRLRSLIVDDEPMGRETLSMLVKEYCPQIEILALAGSVAEAEKLVDQHQPDLVFLDIEMPIANGFELIKRRKDHHFLVIFVTAYDHYAIEAIRANALYYILKPVDPDELIRAVQKAEKIPPREWKSKLDSLMRSFSNPRPGKLAVPSMEGIDFIEVDAINRLSGESNYTHIYLRDGKKLTSSRTLKEYEDILVPYGHFFRAHKTHLINLRCVEKYIKGDGGYVVMTDGTKLEVARSRKNDLLQVLSGE